MNTFAQGAAMETVTEEVLPAGTGAQRWEYEWNEEFRIFSLVFLILAFKVHLRGLPYRSTEREIADWLTEAADPVEVKSF